MNVKPSRLTLFVLVCSLVPLSAFAQNLLTNPNFDQNLNGWTIEGGTAAWDPTDAAGSSASGSARLTNSGSQTHLYQCVQVTPGVKHDLVVRSRIPAGQSATGVTFFGMYYFGTTNCTGSSVGSSSSAGVSEIDRWIVGDQTNYGAVSGEARSARVSLLVNKSSGSTFVAQFDSVQFGPSGSFSQRLVIPAAASITGANNSAFRSDLWLFNESATNSIPVTMTLFCYAGSSCTSVVRNVTLQPRRSVQYRDLVTTLFGQPQTGGAIELSYGAYFGTIAATSRLYSPATGPTYGFAMVARPASEALRRVVFPGLASNGGVLTTGFRTNLGYYNPGSSTANVTITLYRSDGVALGSTTASVPPQTAQQINLFNAVGAGSIVTTDAYVTVVSDIGIFSYVSILDNGSNDSSYVEGILDASL